jgi:hypothetical protein
MADAQALSDTSICNMALGRLGANRIVDFSDNSDENVWAIQCRLHYTQTRDALIRSHWWRFARGRATLSQNAAYTADSTTFEWTYAYDLPADFLAMRNIWEDAGYGEVGQQYPYTIEGNQILSEETTMKIRYVKRVTDPTKFDPLFTEVLILQLALKMVSPLTGAGPDGSRLRQELNIELYGTPRQPGLMDKVRAMDKQETNTATRYESSTWNDAFTAGSGGDPARMNSI